MQRNEKYTIDKKNKIGKVLLKFLKGSDIWI